MEFRTIADWTVKQRLLAVPGLAKVAVFGGEVKQLQIQVHPDRLIQYNLAIEDVLATARRATGVRGAGFIDNDNQRIILQTEGQSLTSEHLAKTILLHHNGANVTLEDVAKVVEAPEPPIGAAAIMGQSGVQLVISEQYGANTLEVTQNVEQALEELRPTLSAEGVVFHPDLFRPANFIQTAIHNVQSSLQIGAVLVVAVLFLFLFNFRTAAISTTAIPLSLLAAVMVLERMGFGLDTMTMGGLAIAVGMVVDDAIIDVENILRRLRENRRMEKSTVSFSSRTGCFHRSTKRCGICNFCGGAGLYSSINYVWSGRTVVRTAGHRIHSSHPCLPAGGPDRNSRAMPRIPWPPPIAREGTSGYTLVESEISFPAASSRAVSRSGDW